MSASNFWLALGYSISSNLGSSQVKFHLLNVHRRAALAGPGWEMKLRILGVSRQHRSKKLAFGDQPLPRLPWRRKAGASPATLRAGLPRPCRGGEDQPGPGRGRGGRSDAAGRDSRGAGRQTGEKGRGYGPALRLQRVGLHLESEAGTGGTTDSHLGIGHPCPGRVRGAHQKLEVSGDIGERASQERAWLQGQGAEGSEDRGPLACPLGARWGWEGCLQRNCGAMPGRRWAEPASQGGGQRDTSGPLLHQPGMGNLVGR